jgi:hypothetical protein
VLFFFLLGYAAFPCTEIYFRMKLVQSVKIGANARANSTRCKYGYEFRVSGISHYSLQVLAIIPKKLLANPWIAATTELLSSDTNPSAMQFFWV